MANLVEMPTRVTPVGFEPDQEFRKAGEYMLVSKYQISVDHTYQRMPTQEKILRIRRNWNWIACGALPVNWREDGRYYLLDGQYRWEAVMGIADIEKIPCIVWCFSGDIEAVRRQEAEAFLTINTNRKSVKAVDKHAAALSIGDPLAHKIEALAAKMGRKVQRGNDDGTVRCVSELAKLLSINEQLTTDVTLHLLDHVCREEGKDIPISISLLRGFYWLEERIANGETLTCLGRDKRWFKRILRIGYRDLVAACVYAHRERGAPGARIFGTALRDRINKGLPSNYHLELKKIEGDR